MTTILVTGVGAIIGYGLLRSIRSARPECTLIGIDIYADAVGQAWTDVFLQAPMTANPNYLHWLAGIIRKYEVDIVIPGFEQDVHCLSANRLFFENLRCKFVLNTSWLINLCRDKWAMDCELTKLNESVRIPSAISGNYSFLVEKFGSPFILKPRNSYASKGFVKVKTQADFDPYANLLGIRLIAQPFVGSDEEEFTVGVFGDGEGVVCSSIMMQRRLASDGSTAKARIVENKTLEKVVTRLCSHFKPLGPTNLQFRLGADWKLLEINPRISSTSSMRTAFGYNEALMSIEFFLNGKLPIQPQIKKGFAARYIEDYVTYDRYNL